MNFVNSIFLGEYHFSLPSLYEMEIIVSDFIIRQIFVSPKIGICFHEMDFYLSSSNTALPFFKGIALFLINVFLPLRQAAFVPFA